MTWFKVDDRLYAHPKWLAATHRSRALWVTAGSWSAGQGTDGRVPRHVLRSLGYTPADATGLVTAGLWSAVRDGWRFHDWAEFQPDAASQQAKREAESDGGALGNHVRWHVRRGVDVPSCGYCSGDIAPDSPPDRVPEGVPDSPPNPPDPYPNPIPDPNCMHGSSPDVTRGPVDNSGHGSSLRVVPGLGVETMHAQSPTPEDAA